MNDAYLEQLYWEFDTLRKKHGDERFRFKCVMRQFANHPDGLMEPEMETVEVIRWECKYCGAYFTIPHLKCEHCNDAVFIELRGTYQRPVKRTTITCEHCGATHG